MDDFDAADEVGMTLFDDDDESEEASHPHDVSSEVLEAKRIALAQWHQTKRTAFIADASSGLDDDDEDHAAAASALLEDEEFMRTYDEHSGQSSCTSLVISFASLGHENQVNFEFMGTFKRLGIRHAILIKDTRKAWYVLGTRASGSFERLLARLQAEIRALQPRRVVTIGCSMGGYAAIRAGCALGANAVLAFSPQIFIDPAERQEHLELPPMGFSDALRRCHALASSSDASWTADTVLPSLLDSIASLASPSPAGAAPHPNQSNGSSKTIAIEVVVGANASGDVLEALLLQERARLHNEAAGRAGKASTAVAVAVHLYKRQGHLVFRHLRGTGQIEAMLTRLMDAGEADAPLTGKYWL